MNLIEAMQRQYSKSKRLLYTYGIPINFAIYGIAILTIWLSSETWLKVLGILVFLMQVTLFVFRIMARGHTDSAEEIRRAAMLKDGLGVEPFRMELASIKEKVGETVNTEPVFLEPYYSSEEDPGPRRMLDITGECAFFTSALARHTCMALALVAGVGSFFAVMGFIVAVQFSTSIVWMSVMVKAVILSIAFWAAGDIAAMAMQFFSLYQATDRLRLRCDHALKSAEENLEAEAMSIFSEYNCAVVQAPPIPTWIYKQYQNTLNDSWRVKEE